MDDQHIVTAWADEYARLEFRLADVTAERDAYQQIAHAALDQLHSMTKALERARTQLYRLTQEIRASGAGEPLPARHPAIPARAHTRCVRSVYRQMGVRNPDTHNEARP